MQGRGLLAAVKPSQGKLSLLASLVMQQARTRRDLGARRVWIGEVIKQTGEYVAADGNCLSGYNFWNQVIPQHHEICSLDE